MAIPLPASVLGIRPAVRLSWCVLAAVASLAAVYGLSPSHPYGQQAIYHLLGLFTPCAVVTGVVRYRPERRLPWFLIAAGMTLTAAGDVWWDAVGWLGGVASFPSGADVAYLSGYLCLTVGLSLIACRAISMRGLDFLDCGILAGAIVLIVFVVLIAPTIDQSGTLVGHLVGVAYPSLDGTLLIAGIPLLLRRPRNASVALLVAFAVLTFGADLTYGVEELHGSYDVGGWLDAVWLLSFGALAAAALDPGMAEAGNPLDRAGWRMSGRLSIVGSAALVVLVALASLRPSSDDAYLVGCALAAVVFALVFLRVHLLATEQYAAKRGLEREVERLAVLQDAQRDVVSDVADLDAVLVRICERVRALTDAGGVVVALEDDGALRIRTVVGRSELRHGDLVADQSLSSAAMAADRVLICRDAMEDDRVDQALARTDAARSVAAAPIHYAGAPIGTLTVLAGSTDAFDAHDADSLQLMASLVSVAVNRSGDFAARMALDALVDSAEDAIVQLSLDGRILTWNAGAERVYGYTADEMIGQPVSVLTPPELGDEAAELAEQVCSTGTSLGYESERLRKDGTRLSVSVIASPVRDARGHVVGITAVVRDVSQRKELEEQLHQAQKMEAVGRLAGGVAHDFNNLLLAMGGYATFIGCDGDATPAIVHNAEQIGVACKRAADLTNQLLAYSRKQVLQPRILDPNEVVGETVRMLGRLVEESIEIVCDLDPRIGAVTADAGRLSQVMMNLGVNAHDAMPDGGTLTIRTSHVTLQNGAAARAGVAPGEHVCISVSDTGVGMDEDLQAKIFEPFFTTKESGRGTGLGLATVYGTVRQSGGNITVQSKPGAGTTFRIFLPACDEIVQQGVEADVEPELDATGTTVLLVEDQDTVREVVAEMLSGAGYAVTAAADGAEALEWAAQAERVDVLVSDVVMPKLNGPELAVRLLELHPGAHVVLTSGYTGDAHLVGGPESLTFLQKPFSAAELRQVVQAPRRVAA